MNNLDARLKKLEENLSKSKPGDLPKYILISESSGRKNEEPDNSPVIEIHASEVYSRLNGEGLEDLLNRAADLERKKLSSPLAVPVLIATTEKMLETAEKSSS
ncbi:MAG: hypothetical protein J7K30_00785 [Deltaproteobacteria bacterium]|nr:hypothetical protein [Deltaproteobacteria bacterium]